LRQQSSKALSQFLDAVQYSAYANEDADYAPLVNELRQLNQYYIAQLKNRGAHNIPASGGEPDMPPDTADTAGKS
jgi:hypothetical protein